MSGADPMRRKCKAKNRQGKQCGQQPIKGGVVCRYHGGSAPQVLKAARERLNDLVDPAINVLAKCVEPDKDGEVPIAGLAAARDILDRTGYKPVEKREDVTPESKDSKQLRGEFTLEQLREIHEELESRKVVH